MDAARWERIQALFHDVADLPEPAQRASLETQCREDPALMTEVLGLLQEDARGDSLLDRDAAYVAGQVLDEGIPPALLDQHFGPYRMTQMLGLGGMGVVNHAVQVDIGCYVGIQIRDDMCHTHGHRDGYACI